MKQGSNKGCASGILGTLAVIGAVIVYVLISSLINRLLIGVRFGSETAGAVFSLYTIGISVAFVLYEAVFIFGQIKLSQESSLNGDSGKTKKWFKFAVIAVIALSLVFAVFSANTFTELREDSISKVCFTTQKEYRWDERNDVLRYSFSCEEDGSLTFNIKMKDGEQIELFGGVSSLSDAFKIQYNTATVSLLSYAAHLSEEFDSSEFIIEKNVTGIEYMEAVYKDSNPVIWAEIQRIID